MNETETTDPSGRRGSLSLVAGRATNSDRTPSSRREPTAVVSFDRRELRVLLDFYGAKVATGEWRDYAIDFSPAKAVFSIFRRTSEAPLYRIEKDPELGRRQGAFSVVAASGLVMRRGHDLARVLTVLQKKLELVRD
ncbi:DUF2794 domain-containing protein [Methylosinus sp. Sm6]|uniref:DUF2794 domain-containing protein n=1 Tax=Methylosinus sp. Sm6 TaxID=2866948 RepID=UPI001C9A2AFF|nr:DUF2794 domain-containing protein [Methylosinus sp. Sm6]MBY6242187.1 DUF2794 domain-containing protein [Methylosinus sp. Sm6]